MAAGLRVDAAGGEQVLDAERNALQRPAAPRASFASLASAMASAWSGVSAT
jgi:hypothetical protein